MSKDLIGYWWVVTCRCCGKETLSKRQDKKTCSAKCRKMWSRKKLGDSVGIDASRFKWQYDKPAKMGGWGHHDDVLFQYRSGQGITQPART